MGMTHSWLRVTELPAEGFAKASADARKALTALGVPLAGFEGTGEPIITADTIVFNGKAPAACEPFEVPQTQFDRRGRARFYSFCKTEGLPYDLAVKVALVILNHHLGEAFAVSSDEKEGQLEAARVKTQELLGFGSRFTLSRE